MNLERALRYAHCIRDRFPDRPLQQPPPTPAEARDILIADRRTRPHRLVDAEAKAIMLLIQTAPLP